MQATGQKGVQFDAGKFNWLGSISREVSVLVSWHASPIKTIQDAKERELVLGGAGVASDNVIFAKMLNDTIGTKFRTLTGYTGSGEILLALERGEVQGYCGWSWSNLKRSRMDWVRDKKINILVQLALSKHEDLPNIPLALDLAKDKESRQVLEMIMSRMSMAWPYVAPPGVPQERVNVLVKAFSDILKDKAFIAEAEKLQVS